MFADVLIDKHLENCLKKKEKEKKKVSKKKWSNFLIFRSFYAFEFIHKI